MGWPKKEISWIIDRVLYVSIPFTWDLHRVRANLQQRSLFWDRAVIGGPAVKLMPDFFDGIDYVTTGNHYNNILQKINPMATRTTIGCPNTCGFCGIGKRLIEGEFKELNQWPDLPIICDNNLLASSKKHFDRVIDRLKKHKGVDFNQGLDARLLEYHHAGRIAEIKGLAKRGVRLSFDSMKYRNTWLDALNKLINAGIPKSKISSYVLIGYNSGVDDAWDRCNFIEGYGVRALPMWFHPLDAHQKNTVTKKQTIFGWNDFERRRIMQWFYKHRDIGNK